MITASMLVDVYIDINILLLFACFLGLISTLLLRVMGLGHAVSVRLGLLRWGFLAVLTIPVAVSLIIVGVLPMNETDPFVRSTASTAFTICRTPTGSSPSSCESLRPEAGAS